MNVQLESKPCPFGCDENDTILLNGHDLLRGLPGNFNIVQCNKCQLLRTNPRPTPETIGLYYPDDYGPYKSTQVPNIKNKSNIFTSQLKSFIKMFFNFKTRVIPKLKIGNMLEIGCASGVYLNEMATKGWDVSGIEFSPKAAEYSRSLGYSVHTGSLESAPEPKNKFDLIVGWMVLEHLHDPLNCLNKLNKWANHNSTLVLSIPNASSFEFKLFKDKWHALHLPNHLFHYTPMSIKKLLNKTGWELEKIHYQRNIGSFLYSLGYVLEEKGYVLLGNKIKVISRYQDFLFYPISCILSLFKKSGYMTIWAKKSNKNAN